MVSCTSSPLTRRSAKLVDLGVVCTISTLGGRSPSPVLGAQHRKELRTTRSSLSLRQLCRQTSSMKTLAHPVLDRSPFPESPRSSSRSLRIYRAGSVAWERSRASRFVAHGCRAMNLSLGGGMAASQTHCRELEARLMAVRSQRTE